MESIDVREKKMAEVEVKGRMALFTQFRVDKDTIPDECIVMICSMGMMLGCPARLNRMCQSIILGQL